MLPQNEICLLQALSMHVEVFPDQETNWVVAFRLGIFQAKFTVHYQFLHLIIKTWPIYCTFYTQLALV